MKKAPSPVLLVGALVLVACTLHVSEAGPNNVEVLGGRCQNGRGCGGRKVCCDWGSDYACCPYDNGVCCGGSGSYGSCCPSGTRCGRSHCLRVDDPYFAHEANMTLLEDPMPAVKQAAIIPSVERAYVPEEAPNNVEVQAGPVCPNGGTCAPGSTCCQYGSDEYSCCGYYNAVCCQAIGNVAACCPAGYRCGANQQCFKMDLPYNALQVHKVSLEKPLPAAQAVLTGSGNNKPTLGARMTFSLNATMTILKGKMGAAATKCPTANCPGEDGNSLCCPFESGVCCKHSPVGCCPKDWTCTDDFILGCKWW